MFNKPKVLLISKPTNLSRALVKKLTENGFQVNIQANVKNAKGYAIEQYRHVICFSEFFDLKYFSRADAKVLLILPYSLYSSTKITQNNSRMTVAYVGKTYSSFQLDLVIKGIFKQLFTLDTSGKEIVISKDEVLTKPAPKIKRKNHIPLIATAIFGLFLIPYIVLIVSLISLSVGIQKIKAGNLKVSQQAFTVSLLGANWSTGSFGLYNKIPLAGELFTPILQLAIVSQRASRMGQESVDLITTTRDLSGKILGKEIYSPSQLGNKIFLNLDFLYNQISVFGGDLKTLPNWQINLIGRYLTTTQIEDIKTKLYWARSLARQLPVLLGEGIPQSYLILFQNNMELRPTGGFIGSFAVVTMDGGRLADTNVSDVYMADGQLKGYVTPPDPIKNYLGEAGWYLRDSNWDPDFPSSALKAEWFLDKEIDKSVNGVIAIDLEVAKSILELTGPIKLADYNLAIDSNNLYERTQSEVETDFFPGSSKKASFLTALVKTLLTQTASISQGDNWLFLKNIFTDLQEKHIQIFMHNKDAQKFVSALGFDGAVSQPVCGGNCYADWLGIVDANVGVNKANLYIKREAKLAVKINKDSIVRTLTLNYENIATPALGILERYKTYVRVLIPINARIISEPVNMNREDLNGRSEMGILMEIMPGGKKSLELTWTTDSRLDLNQNGEYRLYWRKQAGTLADPIAIDIGPLGKYNTNLSQDLFRTFVWK